MFQLVYSSKAVSGLTQEDLSEILETSRKYNNTNQITGCLLFHNDEFLQILEGEKAHVLELYGNIVNDSRHYDVNYLGDNFLQERIFDEWSMAYHKIIPQDVKKLTERLFINNLLVFSELADKSTFTSRLFWHRTKLLLERV